MKNKVFKIVLVVVPVFCIGMFLYMTYFNAAYDHPGKYVYKENCSACHGDNGEGTQMLVPPIDSSDMAHDRFDSLPCWIINGINHPITVNGKHYDQPMYPIIMTQVEMANLLNYLASEMVHVNRKYKSDSVAAIMRSCGQQGL
jgi:nitrite reductase (NO-forming)